MPQAPRAAARAAALPSALALAVALLAGACTDPTTIGGELVEGGVLPVEFDARFPVGIATVRADTSIAAISSSTTGNLGLGCLDDPLLGTSRAEFGFQVVPRDSVLPDPSSIRFDSLVLELPLDPGLQLGDTLAPLAISVRGALAGDIDAPEALTNDPLGDDGVVYGSFAGVAPRTETPVRRYPNDDSGATTDTVGPLLRVRLDASLWDELQPALTTAALQSSTGATSSEIDSAFLLAFPGLVVRADDCGATQAAVSLSTERETRLGLTLYYHRDGVARQYALSPRTNGTNDALIRPTYAKDYAGSLAARLLDGRTPADSLAAVQGLEGLGVRVDLSTLADLDNVAVNYASLVLPVVRDGFAEPYDVLAPRRRNEFGDFVSVGATRADFNALISEREGGTIVRVANPVAGGPDSVDAYRLNVTAFAQEVVEGRFSPELYLFALGTSRRPARIILAGTADPQAPARLELAYTPLP